MGVILAPILEGKVETWKAWIVELQGSRNEAFKDLNTRFGLTRHDAWLAQTPGGPAVIVLVEGPGNEEFMPKLAASENEFDIWFRGQILDIHGMDVSQPPPGPMPELHLDSSR